MAVQDVFRIWGSISSAVAGGRSRGSVGPRGGMATRWVRYDVFAVVESGGAGGGLVRSVAGDLHSPGGIICLGLFMDAD